MMKLFSAGMNYLMAWHASNLFVLLSREDACRLECDVDTSRAAVLSNE